ncbi:MAG: tetratricopeptide repeat protein [Bacteroidetes bacterium]|nr:tetratricopeptide repeat protein [Bacteroidota bacterium]
MLKKITYLLLGLLTCFYSTASKAQSIDSLLRALKTAKHDTTKLSLLAELSEQCEVNEIRKYSEQAIKTADLLLQNNLTQKNKNRVLTLKADAIGNIGYMYSKELDMAQAMSYYNKSLKIRLDINDKMGIANSYNNMALIYEYNGDAINTLSFLEKSLAIREEIGDSVGVANSLTNMGSVYDNTGDIPKALNCYSRSLKISEAINDKHTMAYALHNIASIYEVQNDLETALIYHKKSLKMHEESGDKFGVAYALNFIGYVYMYQKKLELSLETFEQALKMHEENNDKKGAAGAITGIGDVYFLQKKEAEGVAYYEKSIMLLKQIKDVLGVSNQLGNISLIYLKQGKTKLAFLCADSALIFSRKMGFPKLITKAEFACAKVDSALKNYSGAFAHYKQYIIYRDSINNEGTRKASVKNQLKYEFDKKEAVIKEQQEKEKLIAEEKNRFQKIIIACVLAGLLLVIIFAGFVLRSLRITRHQKILIEEKQKEILDSIHYAKRIQTSLLPSEKYLEKHLRKNN